MSSPAAPETSPVRYAPLDLARDFDAAWAAWQKGRPVEGRTVADLAALVDRFESHCTNVLGGEPGDVARWPTLALDACRLARADLTGRAVRAALSLTHCTFTGAANFRGTTFLGRADFSVSEFAGGAARADACFANATFARAATFSGAVFEAPVDFMFATFHDSGSFVGTVFHDEAVFAGATFKAEARFQFALFETGFDLTQTHLAESLDLKDARLEPGPRAAGGRVTLNVRRLRVGHGVLAGDLLLTPGQLRAVAIAGETSTKTEELQTAIQQYSDLVGNFRAMSGPESYKAEDYCRDRCLALQQRLRWQGPGRWWLGGLWALEWLVITVCLGHFQKPQRILLTMLGVIVVCAALYSGAVPGLDLPVRSAAHPDLVLVNQGLGVALYYSLITFATVGYGDWYPEGPTRWVAGLEGLSGVLLAGSFIVALSRRYIR